ncbi:hypothetical protein [Priestia abyssalis]|uniref:hypothetical protein n=1 Tax=Priestia abyssalis TaxID=1221450 RepID=UPI0009950E35|nr:hypothetical protein [Priestia abyssalis]
MFEKNPREEVVYITVDDIKSNGDIKLIDAKVRGITLTKEEWHKKFPGASFKVNVKTSILRTGVMD